MKTLIFLVAIFGLTSSPLSLAKSSSPSAITIGFIPGEDPEYLKKNGIEFAKVLQDKLQVPVNIHISKDYMGLVDAMKDKKVDFAFFTALTFVLAERKAGAKVLLKKVWNGPFYYSAVVTKKSTKVTKIEALKGKRFGFVDEKSASGYLYPLVMLKKKGIDEDKFFSSVRFYGQHENSVKAMMNGDVDAIAVYADDSKGKKGAWSRYAPTQESQVRTLWVSDPIPNDPFCVRQDFYERYPNFTHDLMVVLLDLGDEAPEKNLLKKLYNVSSMTWATTKQYDPVRELDKFLQSKE